MENEDRQELIDTLTGKQRMSGSMADTILVMLIDNCEDKYVSEQLGISLQDWQDLIQAFEEQIRHVVRDIR